MSTRGELAKETGCNIETVRYYEKIGVLPEPPRSSSGYRMYDDSHRRILNFIQRSKTLGFSITRIRELLQLSDATGFHTRKEVKFLTEKHIKEVSEKIKDLKQLRKRLSQISSHCDGSNKSTETCPIMLSLFNDKQIE
jgi:MerR family mercuric resistance operon transcriptional regulator|tara:strand:+ start:969 stop:1382 length:414 start_codon:yes stop_codon:yes gene_type:complete